MAVKKAYGHSCRQPKQQKQQKRARKKSNEHIEYCPLETNLCVKKRNVSFVGRKQATPPSVFRHIRMLISFAQEERGREKMVKIFPSKFMLMNLKPFIESSTHGRFIVNRQPRPSAFQCFLFSCDHVKIDCIDSSDFVVLVLVHLSTFEQRKNKNHFSLAS